MIPNVLLHLIDKYNENGIFINKDDKAYWFNGKRLEFWTNVDENTEVFTHEKNLYSLRSDLKIYKSKQFQSITIKRDIWNDSLNIKHQTCYFATALLNNLQYNSTGGGWLTIFDGKSNINTPSKKYLDYGYQLFAYNNHIYYFGTKSERFNPITNIWTDIADCPVKDCPRIYFVNNCFYANTEYVYYPDIDKWQPLQLIG